MENMSYALYIILTAFFIWIMYGVIETIEAICEFVTWLKKRKQTKIAADLNLRKVMP